MFDYIRYGIIPYEIQIKILRGIESPTAKLIKEIKKNMPKSIFIEMEFYELALLFYGDNTLLPT